MKINCYGTTLKPCHTSFTPNVVGLNHCPKCGKTFTCKTIPSKKSK